MTAKQLEGVARSLETAFNMFDAASVMNNATGQPRFGELLTIAQDYDKQQVATVRAIRHCIEVSMPHRLQNSYSFVMIWKI